MPARSTGSAASVHPLTGMRSHNERTSSMSAPASTSAPSAMSPAIPEKQWYHATTVIARRRSLEQPHQRARGAEAVVDPDDGDARRARREHREQRRHALERGAVTDGRGNGDHGSGREAADD